MSGARFRLAVLGDPLAFTLSPVLHLAGLESVEIEGESEAIRTPSDSLGARLLELAGRGLRGANLTAPLKQAALEFLDHVSGPGRRARSVNTVGFDPGGWWGDTTDGTGFRDLLGSLGRRADAQRAVLLGAGGAARSIALALVEAGCRDLQVSARRPDAAAGSFRDVPGASIVPWGGEVERERLSEASLVVNTTPLDGSVEPLPLRGLPKAALVIDLRYGLKLTEWARAARAAGLEAYDGLGLLVFQARRSLSLWTGREVPVHPLARAVGWPR